MISSSRCRKDAGNRRTTGATLVVVSDKEAVRAALETHGVEVLPGRFLDFRDPWGNRIEIVGYENIQFTKAPYVLRGMGLDGMKKGSAAIQELADKGMAPE